MQTFPLQLGTPWTDQLSAIRREVTEDSGLLREDGVPYRVCRAEQSTFKVKLMPAFMAREDDGIVLEFNANDLYCTKVGERVVGARYPSGIQDAEWQGQRRTPRNLALVEAYIRGVPHIRDSRDRFPKEKLLVMIVAESLRFDRLATDVLNIARAGDPLFKEVDSQDPSDAKPTLSLNLGAWKSIYDYWGAASTAVWKMASAGARKRFEPATPGARKANGPTPSRAGEASGERITLDARSGHEVIEAARTMRVLKRPVPARG